MTKSSLIQFDYACKIPKQLNNLSNIGSGSSGGKTLGNERLSERVGICKAGARRGKRMRKAAMASRLGGLNTAESQGGRRIQ